MPLPFALAPKSFARIVGQDRHKAPRYSPQPIALRIDRPLARPQHLNCGNHQNRTENKKDEMEILEQFDARKDEKRAHHERPDDTVKQYFVLRSLRNLESAKDQHKDEDIVDAERFLNQISREELDSRLRPPGEMNIDGEQ